VVSPPPPNPAADVTEIRQSGNDAVKFLNALFAPGDRILIRPIESWIEGGKKKSQTDYKGTEHVLNGDTDQSGHWCPTPDRLASTIEKHVERSANTRANIFFGVCPRHGGDGQYDMAWQIRVIRVLWADVDHCSVGEAIDRCQAAKLPEPSIVVASGNGAHLYWILAEAVLIDDGDQRAVFTEWIDQGDGKKRPRKFIKDETGEKLWLDIKHNVPDLSPKAQQIQDILAGIAAKIGGDHTKDVSRILRIPGTLNRKDQRNGCEPVPCQLHDFHPERRPLLDLFAPLAQDSPDKQHRQNAAKVKLPSPKNWTANRKDRFEQLLLACDVAEIGTRSEADFALCCWCVGQGVDRDKAWTEAQHVGKFREAGERYFNRTWSKAEQTTRIKIYENATGKAAKKHKASASSIISVAEDAHNSDLGNAKRLIAKFGHKLRHCWPWQKWLVWDGSRWLMDEGGVVQRWAKETVLSMYREAAAINNSHERGALIEHAQGSEKASAINAMISLARSEPGIPVLPHDLDADRWLLNCKNGTLDLRTGKLSPHDPQQMITKLCPVVFDPGAMCPTWAAALNAIFMDRVSLVQYVQRYFGYCLTGKPSTCRPFAYVMHLPSDGWAAVFLFAFDL